MSDKLISTIYDHYKDTCSIISEAIKRRDRLMLFVLIVFSFFTFQSIFPAASNAAINDFLKFKFDLTFKLDFPVVGNLVWFLLLILTLRYFQATIFIERKYPYLHKIEDRLNKELGEEIVTREGKSYLSDYPWFSDWIWAFYTIIFPLLLLLVTSVKIVNEAKNICIANWSFWSFSLLLDAVTFILLAISVILYLFMIHKKEK